MIRWRREFLFQTCSHSCRCAVEVDRQVWPGSGHRVTAGWLATAGRSERDATMLIYHKHTTLAPTLALRNTRKIGDCRFQTNIEASLLTNKLTQMFGCSFVFSRYVLNAQDSINLFIGGNLEYVLSPYVFIFLWRLSIATFFGKYKLILFCKVFSHFYNNFSISSNSSTLQLYGILLIFSQSHLLFKSHCYSHLATIWSFQESYSYSRSSGGIFLPAI